ncbi:MAG: hypothetical protein PF569_04065 [Candidatus Woesearchaeota archaeon]|jgi:hypothetical protein|nr:hypothetical protein [Candidatus Woesearchaeota archaeon]
MAVEEITFSLALPLVVGILVGILEAFFVYEDENMTSGKDFLGDMWHGLLFSVVGVLIASNVSWFTLQEWFPVWLNGILFVDASGNSIVASAIIMAFMLLKIVSSHAIKGISGGGFSEKFWHKLVVAALIGFAPFYIVLLNGPLEGITSKLPEWLQ